MDSGFVFKTIPYVLPKEKWGESTMFSVHVESEENGVSRQAETGTVLVILQIHTHTQSSILGTVSPQPPQERRQDGDSCIQLHSYQ